MLGIGELAYMPQKLPVLLGQAAEVEIGEDVAQQNQPFELDRMQEFERRASPANLGPKMQIGNNNGVKVVSLHALYL
jgi:hypothetical protein